MIALFLVAILSVTTVAALERTLTKDRRDKEAQLLYVGQAYQTAIMHFYQNTPGQGAYPAQLSDLLVDNGKTTTQRYLRRLYFDPMTGSNNWGIVPSEDGKGIIGVYSLSTQQPIKTAGFPPMLAYLGLVPAATYQQWQFIYVPTH